MALIEVKTESMT